MEPTDLERATAVLSLAHHLLSAREAADLITAARAGADLTAELVTRVGETALLAVIAGELRVGFVDLHAPDSPWRADEALATRLGVPALRAHRALPVKHSTSGQTGIALVNPGAQGEIVDWLRGQFPDIVPLLAPASQIDGRLVYLDTAGFADADAGEEEVGESRTPAPAATISNPVVEYLDNLLERAVAEGASDIHFLSQADGTLLVRFRVDGSMRRQAVPLRRREREILGTLLAKCGDTIDASDRTRPQDGTFSFTTAGGRRIDVRLGMLPQAHGPTVVVRILDPNNINRRLEDMGFSTATLAQMRRVLQAPQGSVFFIGPTGSGKLLRLDTPVATPTGNTPIGQLQLGDQVLGGDGRPCTVTGLSAIEQQPDLYRVTFSDGQVIYADFDHQWLVSTHASRNAPRHPRRIAADRRRQAALETISTLETLATVWDGPEEVTAGQLHQILVDHALHREYPRSPSVTAALVATSCPRRHIQREVTRSRTVTRAQETFAYPVRPILGNVAENPARYHEKAARASQLLSGDLPETATLRALDAMLGAGQARTARTVAKRLGLSGHRMQYELTYANEEYTQRHRPSWVYPTSVALKSLAMRLRERFSAVPERAPELTRMTTGEMLAQGLRLRTGHARFAVPVAAGLDLPADLELPVDPYVLGYWLGDGSTDGGQFTVGGDDLDFAVAQISATHPVTWTRDDGGRWTVYCGAADGCPSLRALLRSAGVLGAKQVPGRYLRASYEQRLSLLQGLMDSDGTVDASGSCELSLSDADLARGALELVRSLGIKASITWAQPAGYRGQDGDRVECKDRHRIHFTTTVPVFRLPRKADRLPATVRESARWLYITAVEQVSPDEPEYGPGRCISVDSDDRTYLCSEGYVVTSNTTTLYALLKELPALDMAIMTAEDPIEYRLPNIGQTQIRSDLGEKSLTFAKALRSMLRLDPDVILVGEVRDAETAETAMHAALTGHMVLSTLHAKTAVAAYSRLTDLDVDPPTAAESLSLAVNQRLVRTVHSCADRGRPTDTEISVLTRYGLPVPDEVAHPHPRGCPGCNGTGYRGRVAVVEAMEPSGEVRELVATRAPHGDIVAAATSGEGYTSILADAFRHVAAGRVPVMELMRVAGAGER